MNKNTTKREGRAENMARNKNYFRGGDFDGGFLGGFDGGFDGGFGGRAGRAPLCS